MSILSNWFRQESTKVILNAALRILKALAFGVGEKLWKTTQQAVLEAEALNEGSLSGSEKAKYVANRLKASFPGVKDYVVNLSLELAVAHLKESLIKR